MTLYDLPNETNMNDILVQTSNSIPSLFPAFLFFIFLVVLLGGAIQQRKRTGYSDIPMWSVIASLSTLMITLPLEIVSGIVEPIVIAIVVVITFLSGIWYFTSKSRYEI